MRYKNNVGPQVRRRRYALGWSQSDLATETAIAGFDICRQRRLEDRGPASYVDDRPCSISPKSQSFSAGTLPAANAGEIVFTISWRNWRRRDSDLAENA